MKNCDEMVNSLLERRDRYMMQRRRRTTTLVGVTAAVCCVCLVVLLGFGMWKGGAFEPLEPTAPTEDVIKTEKPTETDAVTQTSKTRASMTIFLNRISAVSAYKLKIDLLEEDYIAMTLDEMNAYYGANVVPTVPADILPWEDQKGGIFKRDGGMGDVYWDQNLLNFSNKDFTREVHLEFAKGKYPLIDYHTFSGKKMSVINGTEVLIGKSDADWYYAKFMHKNVGFVLDANGVTQDEFVAILVSLLQ